MEQDLELDYYPLFLAVEMTGKSEDYLLALGAQRALKFYVRPKNWAYREESNPRTAHIINDPVWVDDHVVLKKVLNGAEATLYFSEQYPNSNLENLDDEEVCILDNDNHFDVVVTRFGVPVAKDRLVIKSEDLAPFLLKQPLDGGASSQVDTESTSTRPIQANSNEFAFSGLLHQPNGVDDWFEVIDAMTGAFHSEHGCTPTEVQAWGQLCTNPPSRYSIKPANNNLSLEMPGATKSLSKRSFGRRWEKYTAKSNPFKPK